MDNLIAEGKAKPFIIVMANGGGIGPPGGGPGRAPAIVLGDQPRQAPLLPPHPMQVRVLLQQLLAQAPGRHQVRADRRDPAVQADESSTSARSSTSYWMSWFRI
jgi:hypothetical protein